MWSRVECICCELCISEEKTPSLVLTQQTVSSVRVRGCLLKETLYSLFLLQEKKIDSLHKQYYKNLHT